MRASCAPRRRAARAAAGARRRASRRSARRSGWRTPARAIAQLVAGVVKRLFGCAAFSVEAGVHGRPCQSMRLGRRRIVVPFPPRRPVRPQRHVGEDRVALDHVERVRVGLAAGARRDAEEAVLGVDGPQPAVVARPQPGDVVADRPRLPARHASRAAPASPGSSCRTPTGTRRSRSASARPGSRARGSACARPASLPCAPASWPGAAPGTSCRAAHCRRSRSRRTRSCCPGEVQMKRRSGLRSPSECRHRVKSVGRQVVEGDRAHARHDAHVEHDVLAVGDLDADLGEARARRTPMRKGTTYIVRPCIAPAKSGVSLA